MKATFLVFALVAATLLAPSVAADTDSQVVGTWSGNWTPKGGVPDAITIELKQESFGKITGKFLTPSPLDFSNVSFNAHTHVFSAEATDKNSGKHYKLDGKVEGTELKGTLDVNDVSGNVMLIKWTYFGSYIGR
ncbi:MAG TPA: hypothetical protein VKY31_07955 [Terriglobia bacterium]|nr:hypothetical protein [Terriglobia bacterium]